jgi:hypothetical protein
MKHPGIESLEAFAAGIRDTAVEAHLAACESCRAKHAELTQGLAEFRANTNVESFLDAVERAAERPAGSAPSTSNVTALRKRQWAGTITVLVAVAAALILWIRVGSEPVASGPTPTVALAFKGAPLQLAVVRERDGKQERFAGSSLEVRPGDRIRAEITSESPQPIAVAVSNAQGERWDLLMPTILDGGTVFSPEAIRFDHEVFDGVLIAGSPENVADAIRNKRYDQVQVVRLRTK